MNGKGHAITTLILSIIVAKYLLSLGVSETFATLFVFGSFLTCHSADVWGISAFSPDMDLIFERKFGLRIHRKWYFHSFVLSLPVIWAGAYFLGKNPSLSSFLFGMAFGWNAHIIEDDFWSRFKHHRKQPFPLWVEVTSLLAMVIAVLGVAGNFSPGYYVLFVSIYKYGALGIIPEKLGFPVGGATV